jgi:hypothetical protein
MRLRRLALPLLCLFSTAVVGWGGPITLGLIPTSQDATPGGFVDVQLSISGLGASSAPSLSVYDIDLLFNFSVISVTNVTFGDPGLGNQLNLAGAGVFSVSDNSVPGQLNLLEVSFNTPAELDSTQAPSFILATIQFQALNFGVSNIVLSINSLGDSIGDPLTAEVFGGSINVNGSTAIPEPSTVLLVLMGLGTIAVWKRR